MKSLVCSRAAVALLALGCSLSNDGEPSGMATSVGGAPNAAGAASNNNQAGSAPQMSLGGAASNPAYPGSGGSGPSELTGGASFGDWSMGPVEAVCKVGQSRACDCPNGVPGTQVCTAPSGSYSQCGCQKPEGAQIYQPPPVPVQLFCGGTACAPRVDDDTSVGAKHCCTETNTCGNQSSFVFGQACVPRGGDPGTPDARCPDEAPNFLDLRGCCRTDGKCGLSIDHLNNWDSGCIERNEVMRLLNDGGAERAFLSAIFLLPNPPADYQPIGCQ